MNFQNPALVAGVDGQNNAIYLFADVNADMDATVRIVGRSSASVNLVNIDIPAQGHQDAFQPQIRYGNGNVGSAIDYWMEFEVIFYNKDTYVPATISTFNVTGLDIDGNGDRLREYDAFYSASSYTLETGSLISVTNLVGNVLSALQPGRRFRGPVAEWGGIDTTATELMATMNYQNTNTMIVRFGATTSGSTTGASRLYSNYFKSFTYSAPQLTTLPLTLLSFSATLNKNQVDLKWTTTNEVNVSHFNIERSTDGVTFNEAGMVMAYGNTSTTKNYSFADNITGITSSVLYYRLRSRDFDGKTQLSETRVIRLSKQKESVTILTYPNPVSNELRITLPSSWQNKPVKIELFNASGQLVRLKKSESASQTENLGMIDLSKGFYVVRATNSLNETSQQSIVKN